MAAGDPLGDALDAGPVLRGEAIHLRPYADGDAAVRATYGRIREISRAFGGDLEADIAMTEHEARAQLEHRFGAGPHWVIADADDRFLGTIRLAPINRANRSCHFGIGIFDPQRLGRGLGTEATRLALGYGFKELGLHRIELTVLAENQRAVASYKKCGFVVEGRLRDTLWRDGRWHDDLVMAAIAR